MKVETIKIGLSIIVKDPMDEFRNMRPEVEVVVNLGDTDRREAFAQMRCEAMGMISRLVSDSQLFLATGQIPQLDSQIVEKVEEKVVPGQTQQELPLVPLERSVVDPSQRNITDPSQIVLTEAPALSEEASIEEVASMFEEPLTMSDEDEPGLFD